MATTTALEEKKELKIALTAASSREVRAHAVSAILFFLLVARFFPVSVLALIGMTWKYLAVAVAVLLANRAISGTPGSPGRKRKRAA